MRNGFFIMLFVLAVSCEGGSPGEVNMPDIADAGLPSPDPTFRLEPAVKSRLSVAFDADATEKLLAWYRPEMRDEVLQTFLELADGASRGEISIENLEFQPSQSDLRNAEIEALTRKMFKKPYDIIIKPDSGR